MTPVRWESSKGSHKAWDGLVDEDPGQAEEGCTCQWPRAPATSGGNLQVPVQGEGTHNWSVHPHPVTLPQTPPTALDKTRGEKMNLEWEE